MRGGGIVGEHDVLFCGPDEVVTLSHSAGSRGVFADGAVQAALYIAALAPGYYTMTDLLRGQLVMRMKKRNCRLLVIALGVGGVLLLCWVSPAMSL